MPGAVAWAWFRLAARRSASDAVLVRLTLAINRALAEPAVIDRFLGLGLQPRILSRAAFGAFLAARFDEDAALIRATGLRAE